MGKPIVKQLIVSITCDDCTGIVEQVAAIVKAHQGNWEQSQLIHLCGKFSGLILVSLPVEQADALQQALKEISKESLNVEIFSTSKAGDSDKHLTFHASGPDAPGIVVELSRAFRELNINVERLDTELSSMPYSGNPLFIAKGSVSLPSSESRQKLEENLMKISDSLALDIEVQD